MFKLYLFSLTLLSAHVFSQESYKSPKVNFKKVESSNINIKETKWDSDIDYEVKDNVEKTQRDLASSPPGETLTEDSPTRDPSSSSNHKEEGPEVVKPKKWKYTPRVYRQDKY